eukprot:g8424.t1
MGGNESKQTSITFPRSPRTEHDDNSVSAAWYPGKVAHKILEASSEIKATIQPVARDGEAWYPGKIVQGVRRAHSERKPQHTSKSRSSGYGKGSRGKEGGKGRGKARGKRRVRQSSLMEEQEFVSKVCETMGFGLDIGGTLLKIVCFEPLPLGRFVNNHSSHNLSASVLPKEEPQESLSRRSSFSNNSQTSFASNNSDSVYPLSCHENENENENGEHTPRLEKQPPQYNFPDHPHAAGRSQSISTPSPSKDLLARRHTNADHHPPSPPRMRATRSNSVPQARSQLKFGAFHHKMSLFLTSLSNVSNCEQDLRLQYECAELGGTFHFLKLPSAHLREFADLLHNSSLTLSSHSRPTGNRFGLTGGRAARLEEMCRTREKRPDAAGCNISFDLAKFDELDCLVKGLNFLLPNFPGECYFWEDAQGKSPLFPRLHKGGAHLQKVRMPRSSEIYPYLLVNIGSGVSILKVTGEHTYERVGGTSLGGGTFLGLVTCLSGADTFNTALRLAERGNSENIDMLVSDIYGGDYEHFKLPGSSVASSFGKLRGVRRSHTGECAVHSQSLPASSSSSFSRLPPSSSTSPALSPSPASSRVQTSSSSSSSSPASPSRASSRPQPSSKHSSSPSPPSPIKHSSSVHSSPSKKKFHRPVLSRETSRNATCTCPPSPEDLARACLVMITNNIGSLAHLHAKVHGISRILFAGNFLTGNHTSAQHLTAALSFWSKNTIRAIFLEHEGYFGAVGALISSLALNSAVPQTPHTATGSPRAFPHYTQEEQQDLCPAEEVEEEDEAQSQEIPIALQPPQQADPGGAHWVVAGQRSAGRRVGFERPDSSVAEMSRAARPGLSTATEDNVQLPPQHYLSSGSTLRRRRRQGSEGREGEDDSAVTERDSTMFHVQRERPVTPEKAGRRREQQTSPHNNKGLHSRLHYHGLHHPLVTEPPRRSPRKRSPRKPGAGAAAAAGGGQGGQGAGGRIGVPQSSRALQLAPLSEQEAEGKRRLSAMVAAAAAKAPGPITLEDQEWAKALSGENVDDLDSPGKHKARTDAAAEHMADGEVMLGEDGRPALFMRVGGQLPHDTGGSIDIAEALTYTPQSEIFLDEDEGMSPRSNSDGGFL